MNTIKAKDLTEKEKIMFWDYFYCSSFVDDMGSPRPWGAPWIWNPEQELEFVPENLSLSPIECLQHGLEHPIEGMARIWYEKMKNEIFSEIQF